MRRFLYALALAWLLAASSAFAAARYFQGPTDNQWDTDDGGGAKSNWSSTTPGFTAAAKPVTGDVVTIDAACECDTDESGAVLAGLTITATKILTIAATGKIYNADANITIPANGLVMQAGSIVRLIETSATRTIQVAGASAITGTGTIQIASATGGAAARLEFTTAGASIIGTSPAAPILIDGGLGAAQSHGIRDAANLFTVQNVAITRCSFGLLFYTASVGSVTGCTIYTIGYSGAYVFGGGRVRFTDCYFYSCNYGVTNLTGEAEYISCVFGQSRAGVPAANATADVQNTLICRTILRKCLLTSATEVSLGAPSPGSMDMVILSTAHDQSEGAFKLWLGMGHTVETEGTVIHTAGGKTVRFASSAATSSTHGYRLRFPIAQWPVTHNDTIVLSTWLRTTAKGNVATLDIDPDGIYGTPVTATCTAAAADTYELVTTGTYTVALSGGAGTKAVVPIYLTIVEASKTWYADDATINGKVQTFDFGWNDVFPIEAGGFPQPPTPTPR